MTTPAAQRLVRLPASSYRVTLALVPAVLAASLAGLFVDGIYRDPGGIRPAMQGQDAVTIGVVPLLVAAAARARAGAARAYLIWAGLLGYVVYTYVGAAFGYHFNALTLLYIGIAAASGMSLAAALGRLDVSALSRLADHGTPRRAVAGFLLFIAAGLTALEVTENVRFLVTGEVPPAVAKAGGITFFPYVLDLGLIVPLSALGAWWLWHRKPSGDLVAGILLIKATSMGAALVSMNWFSIRAGQASDGLTLFYAALAAGGLLLSVWFFRHVRNDHVRI